MKISLKQKKLSSGKKSLFIEYYNGSYIDGNGKKVHNRKFEYLKLYLHGEPNSIQKKENENTLRLAENIVTVKRAEYLQGKHKIVDREKRKITFLRYYNDLKEERYQNKGNYDNWDAAYKHLQKFCSPHVTLEEVDENFVKGFKNFLSNFAKTKSNTPLSQNSKYTYFNKFKAALRQAFEEGYLEENLIRKVKSFEQGESTREYLTHSEVQALYNTDCKYPVLKKAFIFSCLTGLRWSDINKLIWSEVRDEDTGSRVIFRQKKTNAVEYLHISSQARELLGQRTKNSFRVFKGLKYGAVYNTELLRWCMRAGITKHITFHSARHTNAVLLLENGADIYTVSKRLGHRELRTTEIYAKIIDSKMKEAASLIPELNI